MATFTRTFYNCTIVAQCNSIIPAFCEAQGQIRAHRLKPKALFLSFFSPDILPTRRIVVLLFWLSPPWETHPVASGNFHLQVVGLQV